MKKVILAILISVASGGLAQAQISDIQVNKFMTQCIYATGDTNLCRCATRKFLEKTPASELTILNRSTVNLRVLHMSQEAMDLLEPEIEFCAAGGDGSGPCVPDETTLCLQDWRYQVRVQYETSETSGQGRATKLSNDAGTFTFFADSNVEIVAKVLDGCNVPGSDSHWVFLAGLTNVGVDVEILDTETQETWTYFNPPGVAFPPVQDTAAFAACP